MNRIAFFTLLLIAPLTALAQPPRAPSSDSLKTLTAMQDGMVAAVAKAEASVVAIARVDETANPGGAGLNPRLDPDSPDFLPDHFGTGVVIDKRGLILTAAHVVNPKSQHWVTTTAKKRYRARIKALDPRSDLAVLEIDARDLSPITLGDASHLKKGQFAIALGNPYAIARDGSPSAALGIIANIGRRVPVESSPTGGGRDKLYHYAMLIQTDAKLNLGTSGGPLLALNGDMVGLNTSLAALSGYEQAAGYALPVDEGFRRIVDTLKEGREVEYGFLGIKPENLNDEERKANPVGIRVLDVVSGTPAQRYGIQVGDIVTHIDGTEIHDLDELVLKVGQYPVDAKLPVKFQRNRRPLELSIELTKFPIRGEKVITDPASAWRGLRIDYSTTRPEDLERATRMTNVRDGAVVITSVDPNTAGAAARLEPGTFITQINETRVHNPKEFRAATLAQSGTVKLTVVRVNANVSETVEIGTGK